MVEHEIALDAIKREVKWAQVGKPVLVNYGKNNEKSFCFAIQHVEFPENPRNYDTFGKLYCWKACYRIGDSNDFRTKNSALSYLVGRYVEPKDVLDFIKNERASGVFLLQDGDGSITITKGLQKITVLTSEFENHFELSRVSVNLVALLEDEDLLVLLREYAKDIVILPVWASKRSDISLSIDRDEKWDSVCIGFIFAEKSDGTDFVFGMKVPVQIPGGKLPKTNWSMR